jgi:VIT1/CCC1 family predicted Fe2+/Mn2+ transporter
MKTEYRYRFQMATVAWAGALGSALLVLPAACAGSVVWAISCGCMAVFLAFCGQVHGEAARVAKAKEQQERRLGL